MFRSCSTLHNMLSQYDGLNTIGERGDDWEPLELDAIGGTASAAVEMINEQMRMDANPEDLPNDLVDLDVAPQRYGATREPRSVRSGRFGHQPAASEFCRKCGKSTTVDGLPVVREEALVSAVTEAMYDRMNGHGHHMELPNGYSVGPSDPKAWPFLTAFDDPKVYAMRELHALCEAHFMDPMDDSDALRDVMG
eukprot:jgi/Tetstr1/457636/TSEL_044203.t1